MRLFMCLLAVGALGSGCSKAEPFWPGPDRTFYEVSTISPNGTEGSSSRFSSGTYSSADLEFDSYVLRGLTGGGCATSITFGGFGIAGLEDTGGYGNSDALAIATNGTTFDSGLVRLGLPDGWFVNPISAVLTLSEPNTWEIEIRGEQFCESPSGACTIDPNPFWMRVEAEADYFVGLHPDTELSSSQFDAETGQPACIPEI